MTRRRRPGRSRAFTLIELLAASALAATLVLVLFQVIGSLGRTRAALDAKSTSRSADAAYEPWKSDLIDMLRWDLVNSVERQLEPGRMTLAGHGALDRRSLAARHEPVFVVYEIVDGGVLVRRQAGRAMPDNEASWTEIACAGVAAFGVEPTVRPRTVAGIVQQQKSATVRVRIDGVRGDALIDEVIVLP